MADAHVGRMKIICRQEIQNNNQWTVFSENKELKRHLFTSATLMETIGWLIFNDIKPTRTVKIDFEPNQNIANSGHIERLFEKARDLMAGACRDMSPFYSPPVWLRSLKTQSSQSHFFFSLSAERAEIDKQQPFEQIKDRLLIKKFFSALFASMR